MTDLLEMISLGNRNIDHLSDPSELRAAAEQVTELASGFGTSTLMAASSAAERIVGAALVGHADVVHGPHSEADSRSGTVLIVDVNVASGTSLARAARRARHAGAQRVVAVVLFQLAMKLPDPRLWGIDQLIVIDQSKAR